MSPPAGAPEKTPRPRFDVFASIGTRLAIGAYPLLFVLVFGWGYGKEAFDLAAAASNWANYLNVLLLSGFVLVPPAVARLRAGSADRETDRRAIRDHIALERVLLGIGVLVAVVLGATIEGAFSALAAQSDAPLWIWFALLAVLGLSQMPLTLWLGIAQATGAYRLSFAWTALPRAAALVLLALGALAGLAATATLAGAVAIVVAGQWMLVRGARRALAAADPALFSAVGRSGRVLRANLSAGAIALVGMLVTIVPVTIVGRILPGEVGHAHVIVTLSNAVGAVLVAAFFPSSLALVERAGDPRALWRHCVVVARRVALLTALVIGGAWLVLPVCRLFTETCGVPLFAVGSLVIAGAGLRLASLGAYHAAVQQRRPLYSLLSASVEAIVVAGFTWWAVGSWMLFALGWAFVAGGALRLAIALTIEARWLGIRGG